MRVSALLRTYFDIAFLMRGPQALPGGERQMRIGVAVAFVATFLAALALGYDVSRALLLTVLDIGITGAVLRTALQLGGRAERFEQAFGGYCGAAAFVNAAAIPIYLGQGGLTGMGGAGAEGGVADAPSFADFVLLMWNLSLLGHIIRHAFETRLATSILIAFVYVMVLSTAVHSVLPGTARVAEPGSANRSAAPDALSLAGPGTGPDTGPGGAARPRPDSRFSGTDRSPEAFGRVL